MQDRTQDNIQDKKDVEFAISEIGPDKYPPLLLEAKHIPEKMYLVGKLPSRQSKYLCVIGARNNSPYGKSACEHIISGLAGYDIVIVSGLAVGMDSIAHEAALSAGLVTLAFPGSGLDQKSIYPASKQSLARKIVRSGGALLSPFSPEQKGAPWTFPIRNSLMAGVSHATLIVEAREQSGTSITAECALNMHRDVMVVPGSIFSEISRGPLKLLAEGATPVTSSADILQVLGLAKPDECAVSPEGYGYHLSSEQAKLLSYIRESPRSLSEILNHFSLDTSLGAAQVSELEVMNLITEDRGYFRIK